MTQLKKGAYFTDIHIGAKSNSQQHNEDCIQYIEWFCNKIEEEGDVDHIIFAGDWHETRAAINISTLKYSYEIATKLNNIGLPVYMIIGNHDLYHRNNRDVYSVLPFHEFNNFTIIDQPTVIENIGDSVLLCPFLFHEEYPILSEYNNVPYWVGHFEFKDFIVSGYNITMKSGPDHTNFTKPKHIISGHFHKRQTSGNVTYIGNTFPTNFADAGDNERGMMVFDHTKNKMVFHDWEECPKYIKTKLSAILDGSIILPENARVKCIADIEISYEESIEIKQKFIDTHSLREFTIEEADDIVESLVNTETGDITEQLGTVDEMIVNMFAEIESEHIDNQLLIEIYQKL